MLVGWAGGVVVGHLPKLLSLSLSLWVWWPPGPRPKQAELYRRRLALLEAALFGAGVEAFALGIVIGTEPLAASERSCSSAQPSSPPRVSRSPGVAGPVASDEDDPP
jgi:hypothetical protein